MFAHCLRRWLNINPTLAHVTSRVWWDVVGVVCDTSCEILGHHDMCRLMLGQRRRQWPCIKAALMPEVKLGSNRKKLSWKAIDGFNTDSARPRSTTSGAESLVWEDGMSRQPNCTAADYNTWMYTPHSDHGTITQCRFNAGPPSTTLVQHWASIGLSPCVCCAYSDRRQSCICSTQKYRYNADSFVAYVPDISTMLGWFLVANATHIMYVNSTLVYWRPVWQDMKTKKKTIYI